MKTWKPYVATYLGGAVSSIAALEVLPGIIFWPLAGIALAGGALALRRKTTPS